LPNHCDPLIQLLEIKGLVEASTSSARTD
jgi:hypothetical protein